MVGKCAPQLVVVVLYTHTYMYMVAAKNVHHGTMTVLQSLQVDQMVC